MDEWQQASVVRIWNQTSNFKSIILKPTKFYPFDLGNFIEVGVKKHDVNKAYSVVSTPQDKGFLEIGVKLYESGELSPKLFKLVTGDKVWMRGPTGAYFVWKQSSHNTVLVAGGAGICPMVGILRQYKPGQGKMSVLFSTKVGSVYYNEELSKLSIEKNVAYDLIQTGKQGRITKKFLIEKFGGSINPQTDFYVAGPSDFVQSIALWLRETGINENNLKTDDFGA